MSENTYEFVLTEERDGVLIITLNRPQARNAMNRQLTAELREVLEAWENTPEQRVCILTNAGPCFCAGSDLKEKAVGGSEGLEGKEDWGFAGLTKHYFEKPLIAAVNGMCLGGGLEIALACDLVVASSHSTFGLPECRRGLTASGGGGIIRAMQQIPAKAAAELLLVGDSVPAERALDWGLINRVVPEADLIDTAMGLAAGIVACAPLSIQATKRGMYELAAESILYPSESWRKLEKLQADVEASEDAHEGEVAFVEKRPPVWKGR